MMIPNNPDDTAVVSDHSDATENHSAAPPFPSFEERNTPSDPVNRTPETHRIRGTLNGPLETAITVSRDAYFDPDEVAEPYYLGPSGNGNDDDDYGSWHPFSRLPLTEPKVSSLRLWVDPLDDWDYHWMEKHGRHMDLDEKRGSNIPDDQVLYGPLPPGADRDKKLDGDEQLLVCCGQKRPLGKKVTVVVKPTRGGGFVTIHDFVSTVHPYLMARRDEVLEAMDEDPGRKLASSTPDRTPGAPFFPPETRLVVIWYSAPYVDVLDEAYWMRTYKRKPRNGSGKKLTSRERDELVLRTVLGRDGTATS
jgi:hypothetical protein